MAKRIEPHRINHHKEPLFRTATNVTFKQASFDWPGEMFGADANVQKVRRCYEIVPLILSKLIHQHLDEIDEYLNTNWKPGQFKDPFDITIVSTLSNVSHYKYTPGSVVIAISNKEQELKARFMDGTLVTVKRLRGSTQTHFVVSAIDRLLFVRDNASYWLHNTAGLKHYICHVVDNCGYLTGDRCAKGVCKIRFGTPVFFANKIFARQSEKLSRIKIRGKALRDRNVEYSWSQLGQADLLAKGHK